MIEIMKQAFWATGAQLVDLIVPIIGIVILFTLIATLLFGRKA